MTESMNIAEAKSRFSEQVSRASSGERITIRRRERPLAVLIGAAELERLERISQVGLRLALTLGQDSELLAQIERGELHPAMAAFGLWKDVEELADLADVIATNRQNQPTRHPVSYENS
jgi:prevent-host-death family protein